MRPFPLHILSVAASLALLSMAGCAKQQEPIGEVPSDDVPAVPAPAQDRGTTPRDTVSDSCEAMTGAEREACSRRQPQSAPTTVEPTHTPPPDAQ